MIRAGIYQDIGIHIAGVVGKGDELRGDACIVEPDGRHVGGLADKGNGVEGVIGRS